MMAVFTSEISTLTIRTLFLVVLSSSEESSLPAHHWCFPSKVPHAPWNGLGRKGNPLFVRLLRLKTVNLWEMPGPPAPKDPLSLLYALQVSEMSSENHQFCNIKVRGSGGGCDQNCCPKWRKQSLCPRGGLAGALSSWPLQSPQPDSQVPR